MTLSEVLRTGRQHDPDGVMVVMSRQACEEAAAKIETLEASLQRIADYCGNRGAALQSARHMALAALGPSQADRGEKR